MGSVSWDWPAFPPRLAKFIETGVVVYSYNVETEVRVSFSDDNSPWVIVWIVTALAFWIILLVILRIFGLWPW